jgi:phenylalanyl-tRNA synthetase beta chain
MVVIADDVKLHGIGGVMGGLDSSCTMATTNVFLEVALFDPICVTKTGRKINLQSDARFRFERGIDSTSIEWGVDKATEIILNLCGGEVSEITTDQSLEHTKKIIEYNLNKTKTLSGVDIDLNRQIKILKNLGFVIKSQKNEVITIEVPHFRSDIDDAADIVEEIVRIYGYDKIKPQSVIKEPRIKKEILNGKLKSFYKSKRIIASRGYLETITWSFVSSEHASLGNKKENVIIKNPISSGLNTMRSSIFPNLLSSINININRLYNSGKLFEVGPQYSGSKEENQQMVASGIQYGTVHTETWGDEKRISDVFDVKSDVYFVLDQLNVPINNILYDESDNNFFHPGKSARLRIGKSILARFGEIHPFILQKFEINTNVSGFEILLDQVSKFQLKMSSTKKAYDNNALQAIERDFAFLFPKNIKAGEIINKIIKIDKKLIKKVTIFDVFDGNKLPENMKSIAIKVILQPIEKTFTDSEIEVISNTIIDLISKTFEGKLRQ